MLAGMDAVGHEPAASLGVAQSMRIAWRQGRMNGNGRRP